MPLEQAGVLPVISPLTTKAEDIVQLCDLFNGFLFTGGHNVAPELFGEQRLPQVAEICPERDALENAVLDYALKNDKAILGICGVSK